MHHLRFCSLILLAACATDPEIAFDEAESEVGTGAVVINEFTPGSSGKIEIYNGSDLPVDLTGWQVDDISGGYAPKSLTGVLPPGAHLVIGFAGVNYASIDQVRLIDQTGAVRDVQSNFYAGTSTLGQCFGRRPDGGAWATGPIACSLGGSNGCPAVGTCDDADVCTTGETFQADCTCGGGEAVDCNDDNPCTGDACTQEDGCRNDPVADGTPCGTGTCQAGACVAASGEASIVSFSRRDRIILQGVVVTPNGPFVGEALVDGDTIECVATSCAGHPNAFDASVVQTGGVIFPGMIDAHNHILFDIFDETHWSPSKIYTNHNQWPNEAKYKALVDTKQYLNGETSGGAISIGCEMNKYGELKALIAGTTSVQGSANPADKQCYGSVARTIDQAPNDLGADHIQTATIFPSRSAADAVCNNIHSGKTDAYAIHVGEGVDATSRREFATLGTITTAAECLYSEHTTIIHGTALGDAELSTMAARGMSLVWSPRSNVFLYGAGTDFSKTTNIPLVRAKGINIALAPDWSIGGSQNLLDELRFADQVDNAQFGDLLSSRDLVDMVTINAARALGVDHRLGSIEVGKKADLFVVPGDLAGAYDALLAATPRSVRLTIVNGRVLYGDSQLQDLGADNASCETLDICSGGKFVCVAEAAATVTNKLGQSFAEIKNAIDTGLAAYDALDLTPYDFSPIVPLVRCETGN